MGANSKIAWTDDTFNPWMGCTEVSAGCAHCYARRDNIRYGRHVWGHGVPRQRTSADNWAKPVQWDKECKALGVRRKVFCASWADVFDLEVPDKWRLDLFELIEKTQHLDWLLVTKRAEAMHYFMTDGSVGSPSVPVVPYVHLEDGMWLRDAIREKMKRERGVA